MTQLKQFKLTFKEALSGNYPATEIESFFNILGEAFLKMNRLEMALNPKRELSEKEESEFKQALSRLRNHEPIQYILGKTEFFGLSFMVNPHVLIPRPETEELVEWIIRDITAGFQPSTTGFSILDIGTGSGCIAISLAKHIPQARVYAIDVSKEALLLAKENALKSNVSIEFIEANILELEQLPQQFDLIVSNPPYVRKLEKKEMQPNVTAHEPSLALYVEDEDPLVFYRKITQLASKNLSKNGNLYFEINQYLSEEMKALVYKEGFSSVEIRKDIYGNYRMLKATHNEY